MYRLYIPTVKETTQINKRRAKKHLESIMRCVIIQIEIAKIVNKEIHLFISGTRNSEPPSNA